MELIQYQEQHAAAVANFFLLDHAIDEHPTAELTISGHIENIIQVVALANQHVVAFFVLDDSPMKTLYSSEPATILLRGLAIDSLDSLQGYGVETLKLACAYVMDFFPEKKEIVVGVSEHAPEVLASYQDAGFTDTKRVLVSEKGSQKILSLKL
jgi:hypothetical protein